MTKEEVKAKFEDGDMPTGQDFADLIDLIPDPNAESLENYYTADENMDAGQPVVFTDDGKVRKMINTPSLGTHAVTGITGDPYIFGNTLNDTQGIVVIANNDESTPANNFVKVALITSADHLTTTMGALVTLAGTVIDKAMDKRPMFLRLSEISFAIIAQTTAAANCYVYHVDVIDAVPTIVLVNTFAVSDVIMEIPEAAICDNGGTIVDEIYFSALDQGMTEDSIQVYKLTLSTETLTTFDPVELSCKVNTVTDIYIRCVSSGVAGTFYVAFNKPATDNYIIVAHVTENLSPVSVTITEYVQTEQNMIANFIKLGDESFFIVCFISDEGSASLISYLYNTEGNDLISGNGSNLVEIQNTSSLLFEKRFDDAATRTMLTFIGTNNSSGAFSVSVCIYMYSEGVVNQFDVVQNKYSLFFIKNEISIICLVDKTITLDYDSGADIIVTRVFNQNNEYITDGIDEGFQFAGFTQSSVIEDGLVKIAGATNYSDCHTGLLAGFMYYLKQDNTLLCLKPSKDFIFYCYINLNPASVTARSVNVFYALSASKVIQADTKSFVNSNFIKSVENVLMTFMQ